MKPRHVSFVPGAPARAREDVLDAINQSRSLDDFVQIWLASMNGEVSFTLGDHEPANLSQSLRVIAHSDNEEIAHALYDLEALKATFPEVTSVDRYIKGFDSFGRCIFDDDAFDAFEASLGYEYNDELCGPLGPRASVLKVVLSYVVSGNGEVHISRYDPFDIENADGFDPDNIFSLSLLYRAPHEVKGCTPMFGTFLYVHAQ